jgi:hypothetical protein
LVRRSRIKSDAGEACIKSLTTILALLLISPCSSSTLIKVSDPDARIFVNGEYVGVGGALDSGNMPVPVGVTFSSR